MKESRDEYLLGSIHDRSFISEMNEGDIDKALENVDTFSENDELKMKVRMKEGEVEKQDLEFWGSKLLEDIQSNPFINLSPNKNNELEPKLTRGTSL